MSVFCIWNDAVNQIREKEKPGHGILGTELNFPTWEEAHSWLIALREKELQAAERRLNNAKRSLQKARAMGGSPTNRPEIVQEHVSSPRQSGAEGGT